jgi:hypothetical protein
MFLERWAKLWVGRQIRSDRSMLMMTVADHNPQRIELVRVKNSSNSHNIKSKVYSNLLYVV